MSVTVRKISLVAVLGLLFAGVAWGQIVSLSGRVADPQGGVVVNAAITLSQPNTISRTTRSGPTATSHSPMSGVGTYTLEVEADGFQRWSQGVTVASERGPVEVSLQVAGLFPPAARIEALARRVASRSF